MPKKDKPINVNLLSSDKFESTSVGKIIHWALSAGKIILFIVFLAVIGSLIYRFNLDRQIENLTQNIETNTYAIQEFSQTEARIINLQNKLNHIDDLTTNQPQLNLALRKLENNLPLNVYLETIDVSQNQINFIGIAANEAVFSNMLSALQSETDFSEIVIDELQSSGLQNPEVNFTIRLKFDIQG